jgi:hypothetical protein
MQLFNITREQYIAVLETEVETLRRYYYKPETEGTGYFNTAIAVLEQRINELKTDSGISDEKFVYRNISNQN